MFGVCCEDVYECKWVCGSHSVTSHLTSWHRICHQTWSSSIWPNQQARKLRRFSCFHSPNTGVTGTCCHIWIFMWVLEIQTPHVLSHALRWLSPIPSLATLLLSKAFHHPNGEPCTLSVSVHICLGNDCLKEQKQNFPGCKDWSNLPLHPAYLSIVSL